MASSIIEKRMNNLVSKGYLSNLNISNSGISVLEKGFIYVYTTDDNTSNLPSISGNKACVVFYVPSSDSVSIGTMYLLNGYDSNIYTRIHDSNGWGAWTSITADYKKGDAYGLTGYGLYTGYISGGQKTVRFFIPFNNRTRSTNVSVMNESLVCTIRHSSGGYIVNNENVYNNANIESVSLRVVDYGIQVAINFVNALSYTNNSTVVALANGTFVFN